MIRLNLPYRPFGVAVVLLAVTLCSCREAPVPPQIEKTVSDVEGFDLVFDESAAPATFGLFELGYAIKAGYGYFTYRGKSYRSVGGGSVLIRPITTSTADFTVRETAQARDEHGYVTTSLLQILDKANGQELARRTLVAHRIEDGTGWTGDHAIKFVREVLKSSQTPGRAADYQPTKAQVELSRSPSSPSYPEQAKPKHCPEALRIERRPHNSTISGEGFEFLPHHPLKLVACGSGRVLVTSGVYASDLYFDVLTLTGEHIAQGYVRLPLPTEAHWAELTEVNLDERSVGITLLTNEKLNFKSPLSAYGLLRIRTDWK